MRHKTGKLNRDQYRYGACRSAIDHDRSSSGYYLIGTTVQPNDSFALFFFPGADRPRKVRVGDMPGSSRKIVNIEPGKVILLDQDGDKITVEAGPPPKR